MLRKLSLHGFKSFCDRTEVALGSGITAIVGPNGCGKSNLADALRWVLGEQNPRILRSAKQQDVIFTGTEKRKAMGMAEVRLLLDGVNNGGETEIIRRLTRDGSSEYRLNGKIVRWKDIIETLSGTGLSHTGYVVIGQGMIQELVAGKPEDRRAWIEEASGVARVRLDKRETEAKLEAAKAGLARLDDLIVELSARKARLSSDRETAAEYRRLMARRREIELSMWLYQVEEEGKRVVALRRRLEKHKSDLQTLELTLPKMRAEEASVASECDRLEQEQKEVRDQREKAAGELLALERKRDGARNLLHLLKKELEARTVRKAAIERDLNNRAKEDESLKAQADLLSEKYRAAQENLRQAEEERRRSEASFKDLSERVLALRQETLALTSAHNACQKTRNDQRARVESKRRDLQDLKNWLANAASQEKALETELSALTTELESTKSGVAQASEQVRSLADKAKSAREALDRAATSERNIGARLTGVRARKKLLMDLEKSFEGYGRGPRTVLEGRAAGRLKGIEGAVGELIDCEARYIPALSAAIGGAAENIVVQDETAAKEAIQLLKETKSGRVTFLPLSLLRPREMNPRVLALAREMKGVRPMIDVVSYPAHLDICVKYLLGRVVLADTMDIALSFMKASGWATRVVTMTGESLDPGGAITGGDAPRHEAIFRRKQELAEIQAQEAQLVKDLTDALSLRKSLEKEISLLGQEHEKARADLSRREAQMVRLGDAKSRTEESLRSLRAQSAQKAAAVIPLEGEISALTLEMEATAAEEKRISAEMEEKEVELRECEEKMRESLSRDQGLSSELRRLAEEKENLERDLSALLRRRESLSGETTSLRSSLEVETNEIARQEVLLRETEAEESRLSEVIAKLDGEVSALAARLEEVTSRRDALLARVSAIRGDMERAERDMASLATKIEESKQELSSLSEAYEETREYIASEFGINDPDYVRHERIPRAVGTQKLEEIDSAISALGGVNLKAEEEHAELSDRIEIINLEKEDILQAIEEINLTRELVEKEIQSRFMETFRLVSESFSEVFRDLFGGGSASLSLVEDTLGVEVSAEPPGRKQKQLNLLSGGERSLCGIALIFAILSVKPSPLIVLDEVDTALDEANVLRFGQFLRRYSKDTQFLVITHQKVTMEHADLLYGVTMPEPGVSRVFGMRLENR